MKKRALISVYNKTGLIEFVKKLVQNNFEIISTSGTARLLAENGIGLTTIEDLTGYNEILNGRVKTLHPVVYAGILADKTNPGHVKEINALELGFIDLVVVNLYPFKDTIKQENCTVDEAIEQIDIGGVSLIRAAAKNFKSVSVVVSPSQYDEFINSLENPVYDMNAAFAEKAFKYISDYDYEIFKYFSDMNETDDQTKPFALSYKDSEALRYGENPHQSAMVYFDENRSFNKTFTKLHGKELSFNNLLDINAAYSLILEFDEPTAAIVKHTNPCGVACDDDLTEAFIKALASDNVSAFGGIIIINGTIDYRTAQEIDKIFSEIVLGLDFADSAFELLSKKKNRRLVRFKREGNLNTIDIRSINGGLLVQNIDNVLIDENKLKYVTERKPDKDQMTDLLFAMKVAKHTKSNSVVYTRNRQTLGIGGGQPSRVDSSMLAIEKAGRFGFDLKGSVLASDAFFPFPDNIEEAAKAGAVCVIQPGGSVRDEEVIRAANEAGIAMVFTGIRHFKH